MEDIKFTLEGAQEAEQILNSLNARDKNRVYLNINRQAGNIVRQKLRALAPSQSIKKNVVVQKGREHSTQIVVAFSKKAFYVRFLEGGTEVRTIRGGKKGKKKVYKEQANRGAITPRPFVKQAHDSAAVEIQSRMGKDYLEFLNNALKKEIKKVGKKLLR